MNIDINLVENSINSVVNDTLKQLKGELHPKITKHEAISKLGIISAFVITLRDEATEQGLSDEVLDCIWELKRESDNNLEMLFE